MDNSTVWANRKHTAFWALALLFFIQLFTLYVESIYRMSLIKLSMGLEMLGICFLLGPLALLVIPLRLERAVTVVAIAGLALTRVIAPFLGASAQIVVAGAGVACFLILLVYVRTGSNPEVNWGESIASAVFLSILLRSIEVSTLDVSMLGREWLPGCILSTAMVAQWTWASIGFEKTPTRSDTTGSAASSFVLAQSLFLFSTLVFVLLLMTSPGVVSAWSGAEYWWAIAISLLGWLGAPLLMRRWVPPRSILVLWNLIFVFSIVGGILANRVTFPVVAESAPVIVGADRWWQHAPLYAALALSPVLVWNFAFAFSGAGLVSLRGSAISIFAGVLTLFVVTLLLIFSNVWGYVGDLSHAMRNGFHIPFIAAGALMLVTLSMPTRGEWRPQPAVLYTQKRFGAILALAGFVVPLIISSYQRVAPSPEHVNELVVVTYNMQQGSRVNGDQRYWEQAKFVAGKNPDIVFLQESDTTRPSGGNVNGPQVIAEELGFHLYYGPKTVTGTFGTAILSRFPLENTRTIFTYSDADEVATAIAEIIVNGKRITLFCNHPAGSDPVMNAHADMLVTEAGKCENVIAAGDFNSRPDEEPFKRIAAALTDSWAAIQPQPTLTGPEGSKWLDPNRRIDHVFVSQNFGVKEVEYTLPPASLTDHPAYRCVLTFE